MSNLYFEKCHFTFKSIGDQPSTLATFVRLLLFPLLDFNYSKKSANYKFRRRLVRQRCVAEKYLSPNLDEHCMEDTNLTWCISYPSGGPPFPRRYVSW